MIQNIYIVTGQRLSYLGHDREPQVYEFNLGTYATEFLAEAAITKAINEQACRVSCDMIEGKKCSWNDGKNVLRFHVDMITFES